MRKILSLFLLLTITAQAQVQLCMKPVADTRTVLAGDASVTFTLADNPLYMVNVCQLVPGTDNQAFRIRYNGETADYKWHLGIPTSAAATYTGVGATAGYMPLAATCGSGTGENVSTRAFVANASSATLYKSTWAQGASTTASAAAAQHSTMAGYWSGGTDAITSAELFMASGTLAAGTAGLWELALYKTSDVGKTYGPCTLISRTDASGASTVDLSLGNYKRHVAVLLGVVPSVDGANIYGRVGTSGGIIAADYARHHNLSASSSSAYFALSSTSSGLLARCDGAGNVSGENLCQVIELPNSSGAYKIVSAQGAFVTSSGNASMCNGAGVWKGGTDQLTTYRILPSSGTITGTILWFGIN